MAAILYKWFLLMALLPVRPAAKEVHPFFVTVTEIEHNAAARAVEISCKLFTDDFEKALRQQYRTAVDLVEPKDKNAMNRLITDYVSKHFQLKLDGKAAALSFVGFERQEDAIYTYWEVTGIPAVKRLDIVSNLLYEYKKEQFGILHVTVGGNRKSARLVNPDERTTLEF